MWGATSGSGSDSAVHLLIPDNTTVLRRQRGTCQLELGSEILLLIIDRQPLQALFMQLNIQLSKGFGQTIQLTTYDGDVVFVL